MKQESRFVADLYRYLAPFINTNCDLYLSLDGIAARKGVTESRFVDADVPDLWFTLIGSDKPVLIEAKVLVDPKRVKVNQRQLTAWRSSGVHKPIAWVAADEKFENFYYWTHDDFLPILNASKATRKYPDFRMPANNVHHFVEVRQLALHILRSA